MKRKRRKMQAEMKQRNMFEGRALIVIGRERNGTERQDLLPWRSEGEVMRGERKALHHKDDIHL